MKKNVLVYPCGSEIGLEIQKSLGQSTHFNLIGGSGAKDHGMMVYENYIGDMPYVDEPDFIEKINQVIESYAIDFIFPAHDSVVVSLAHAKAANQLLCEVITSPLETCEIARSKKRTYETLGSVIPTATVYKKEQLSSEEFPLFLKPDVGQGSKGTQLVRTMEELEFFLKKDSSLLILEYLPGKEYTVDCFTNKDGELIYAAGRERSRVSGGISVNSSLVHDDRFKQLAEGINRQLSLRGGWFFQVKARNDGELVLLEIATRVAGTMGLSRGRGVNIPLLSLFDAMNLDVGVLVNDYDITIDRALGNSYRLDLSYGCVYLDFDDIVIQDGEVNPAVMAFVYQCHNRNIPVNLLTRHAENLQATLERFHLEHVFTSLIWLRQADDEKYHYIKENDAIFIDDSFEERKKVHEKCNIPVFDGHMIECLMSN